MTSYDRTNSVDAMGDVSSAGYELHSLIKRIQEHGVSAEDKAKLLTWIPKARKVVEEIALLCATKTPSVEDSLNEILEFGEWNPHREYVITELNMPHMVEAMGPVTTWTMSGNRVKEWLDRESFLTERIAHIWLVEDDGTLTLKR